MEALWFVIKKGKTSESSSFFIPGFIPQLQFEAIVLATLYFMFNKLTIWTKSTGLLTYMLKKFNEDVEN